MPNSDALVLIESINQTGITICTRLDSILFFMLLKLAVGFQVPRPAAHAETSVL